MSSHVLLPQLDAERPATLSPVVLQGLLRDELGFEGVIVSDALDMAGASGDIGVPAAAVRAIAAGCDLLCIGTGNTDEQVAAIERALDDAVAVGTLPAARLEDAATRTRALAAGLPGPLEPVPAPRFDIDRAIAAFDAPRDLVVEPAAAILTLETVANIAVGASPWGPLAAGAETTAVFAGDDIDVRGKAAVIVGKDNHRHEWTRAVIDRAREQNPSVLVVDMGWPSPDRRYADIATFGASEFAGRALLTLLGDRA
jgi:beta-N-acetylhexosaminidase